MRTILNRVLLRTAGIAAGALLALAVAVPPAAAASGSEAVTIMTFSAPVALPGISLPAGTYRFVITGSSNNIVQVFSKDGMKLYATRFTIPRIWAGRAEQFTATFHETPAGMPPALAAWLNAGRKGGHELLYSQQELAAATGRQTESAR